MRKFFNTVFFCSAALAAATFTACSSDEETPTATHIVEFDPTPVNGTIYVTPGSTLNVYTYVYITDGNNADNDAVTFQFTAPTWMEDIDTTDHSFYANITATAEANASMVLKATSVENPAASASVTIKVVAAATLKDLFIAAVNALPDPENITYTHADALDAASALYYRLPYEFQQDADVQTARQKLNACEDVFWDLPERYKCTFSGNTATLTPLDYSGNPGVGASLIMKYEKAGNFPCGTYTTTSWRLDEDRYYQVKLTLKEDNTYEAAYRYSTNAAGNNPTDWETEITGTYTYTGSQNAADGMLYLTQE
ncbi:MAG: hypothetical protein LBR65_01105 [Culturomica sp.]|nr:hypothetical protein [Culturomica sp.]